MKLQEEKIALYQHSTSEVNKLLWKIEKFYIEYKPVLNLGEDIKFRIEIEYESANQREVTTYIETEKTSTHVHFDQDILGNDIKTWLNFIKLWIIYEEIIYRFLFGEYVTGREKIYKYSSPVRLEYLKYLQLYNLNNCKNLDELITRLKLGKYYGLNFMNTNTSIKNNGKNTIEIRVANGTLEPIIIQNNILFIAKLFQKAHHISETFLNNKIEKMSIYGEENFDDINIYDAIELSDLIFDNERDKLSFLRQYIKSYELSTNFKKVSTFIKK